MATPAAALRTMSVRPMRSRVVVPAASPVSGRVDGRVSPGFVVVLSEMTVIGRRQSVQLASRLWGMRSCGQRR